MIFRAIDNYRNSTLLGRVPDHHFVTASFLPHFPIHFNRINLLLLTFISPFKYACVLSWRCCVACLSTAASKGALKITRMGCTQVIVRSGTSASSVLQSFCKTSRMEAAFFFMYICNQQHLVAFTGRFPLLPHPHAHNSLVAPDVVLEHDSNSLAILQLLIRRTFPQKMTLLRA